MNINGILCQKHAQAECVSSCQLMGKSAGSIVVMISAL